MTTIHGSIIDRKSALAYHPVPISVEQINSLFEAARWAPSSYNEQPWKFYFASRSNPHKFEAMLSLLMPGNSEWAKNSSLIIISTARTFLSLNGKENFYAMHDTGLATANILVQAQTIGLVTHIMGGFDRDGAKRLLDLPDDCIPVAAIAVGLAGDNELLSEANKRRTNAPRLRRALDEMSQEF